MCIISLKFILPCNTKVLIWNICCKSCVSQIEQWLLVAILNYETGQLGVCSFQRNMHTVLYLLTKLHIIQKYFKVNILPYFSPCFLLIAIILECYSERCVEKLTMKDFMHGLLLDLVFEKVLFLSWKKGKASQFRLIPILMSSDRKSDLVYQIGIQVYLKNNIHFLSTFRSLAVSIASTLHLLNLCDSCSVFISLVISCAWNLDQ